ncbi:MAG: hypothetical protein OJF52_001002 [Nitrospira sp.]|nr:MAG: hypothetical protein OJF52_001002 [Nitrospira sp.]
MHLPMNAGQIWGMPIVIGMLSVIGLLSALLGDGFWDVLSWLALAAPVVVTLWCVLRSLPRRRRFLAPRS